ncbi:MAG: helix-turn-helix domain-containing protein [Desulfitobacteriaceae bacterium]|nr:helix-turn-helix domain-containing protein [Desulfitobacteriaceae bacterium]MDD4752951.1 helix-turn-helix domain-containing protein [Desulfitobacteriaceae bacterium]
MNRLAKKINEARIAAGLTEKELAMKCGLSVSYILQVETGKKIINESVAEKILKVLGAKEKFIDEEKPAEKLATNNKASKFPKSIIIEPTNSWADALAGLIKKYPVYDLLSGKTVSFKELPIIHKKIYGYHPDKIMFVKSSNSEMAAFRIEKDDILTVYITKEIQNSGIYLCEMDDRKMIRQIRREDNKLILQQYANDSSALIVDIKNIKVIGRIVRNEFSIF